MRKILSLILYLVLLTAIAGSSISENKQGVSKETRFAVYFDELVNKSEIIAEVKILDYINEVDEPFERTFFNAELTEVYKGGEDLSDNKIIITQLGNKKWIPEHNPLFQKDEKYVLFLSKGDHKAYAIIGSSIGTFDEAEDNGNKYLLKRELADPQLEDLNNKNLKDKMNSKLKNKKYVQCFEKDKFIKKLKDNLSKR